VNSPHQAQLRETLLAYIALARRRRPRGLNISQLIISG
jgi:hypothetical protein